MANSNAIATVTIQDQDLISPGFINLVQRASALVTFPAAVAVQYSGYQVVTNLVAANLFPSGVNVAFVYVRNANTAGTSALALTLSISGGGSAVINLAPGAIFLWANPVINSGAGSAVNTFSQVGYAAFNSPVTMEYLFAY